MHPGVLRVHGAAVHDGRAGLWKDLADPVERSIRIHARAGRASKPAGRRRFKLKACRKG
jgi:hypothetical protein